MALRIYGRRCDLKVRFQCINISDRARVGQVKPCAGKPFIEEPGPSRILAGRSVTDHVGDGFGANRAKQTVEDKEIDRFVPERKGEVPAERRFGQVARRVELPALCGPGGESRLGAA